MSDLIDVIDKKDQQINELRELIDALIGEFRERGLEQLPLWAENEVLRIMGDPRARPPVIS